MSCMRRIDGYCNSPSLFDNRHLNGYKVIEGYHTNNPVIYIINSPTIKPAIIAVLELIFF